MTRVRDPTPPIAIIGMGMRLPGGVSTAEGLWDLLVDKKSGKCRVPADRYNIDGFYGDKSHHQKVASQEGYFLQDVNLKAFDTSFFTSYQSKRQMLNAADPRQRLLLEVVWECMESAGQTNMRGSNTGVYIGLFDHDWYDLLQKDTQVPDILPIVSGSDFALSTQISRVYDLRGPSMVVETGCSAALTGLHLACQALRNGDCSAAIVAGASIIMSPSTTLDMSGQKMLSPTGSCKTFDASADGYSRGEAVNALLIKPLEDALRDNDPVRAIITSTAVNADGGTMNLGMPSPKCHESMIRRAYELAGIADFSQTPYVECHGTGTKVGDPLETAAVANVFGKAETYIGSVKPNVGHSEGASGITSIIKAVLALEKRTIPPNINYSTPNPKIPFEKYNLKVPVEPTPWPKDRQLRISVNSFGIGGSNAHVILESVSSLAPSVSPSLAEAQGHDASADGHMLSSYSIEDAGAVNSGTNCSRIAQFWTRPSRELTFPDGHGATPHASDLDDSTTDTTGVVETWPVLLPLSASSEKSLRLRVDHLQHYLESRPHDMNAIAYTLGSRRVHLPCRTFAIHDSNGCDPPQFEPPRSIPSTKPKAIFLFTGQGAQWAGMGKRLVTQLPSFREDMQRMDQALQALTDPPKWTIQDILCSDAPLDVIDVPEYAQPLCVALQIGLVNYLAKCNIIPHAVIGHSSGEIAAAYAAGAMTMSEAIICGYLRGQVIKRHERRGSMAAVNLGKMEVLPYLNDDVQIACENCSSSVTLSGHPEALERVLTVIQDANDGVSVQRLRVNIAYHSDHMSDAAEEYEKMMTPYLSERGATIPFYSTVTGKVIESGDGLCPWKPGYWRSNLRCRVLFHDAMRSLLKDMPHDSTIFMEIGTHSSLQGPVQRTLQRAPELDAGKRSYVPTLIKDGHPIKSVLDSLGRMYAMGCDLNFPFIQGVEAASAVVLTDMPNYPWDHDTEHWNESRLSRAWRFRKHPDHELLGSRCLEAADPEPAWRKVLRVSDVPWLMDHRVANNIVFPCAGYIAMMGEGIRQVTGSQRYTLRDLAVKSAMLLHESTTTEIMTTMRPLQLTKYTNSSTWFEIHISSFNGTSWVQNCTAQGRAETAASLPSGDASAESNWRPVREEAFYRQAQRLGMHFGPRFQGLKGTTASTTRAEATSCIRDEEYEYATYSIHPLTIDLCLQLCAVAIVKGIPRHMESLSIPVGISSVTVGTGGPDLMAKAMAHHSVSDGTHADVVAKEDATDIVVIDIKGVQGRALDVDDWSTKQGHIARLEWRPDIEFLQVKDLVLRNPDRSPRGKRISMERLAVLCIIDMVDQIDSMEASISQRQLDQVAWLRRERERMSQGGLDWLVSEASGWTLCDAEARSGLLKSMRRELEASDDPEVTHFALTVSQLMESNNLEALLSGTDAAELFASQCGGMLKMSNVSSGVIDAERLFGLLSHAKPTLRVLEIGGDVASAVLQAMKSSGGVAMYSEYVVTHSHGQVLAGLQTQLKDQGLSFKGLDISRDPMEQGFSPGHYDLVIASMTTPLLHSSLKHIHSLLRPGGRLFLECLQPCNWRFPRLIMGWCPGWPEDSSTKESLTGTQKDWDKRLREAGFSGLDMVLFDDDAKYCLGAWMISTAATASTVRGGSVTLLYNKEKCQFAQDLASAWAQRGIKVLWRTLDGECLDEESDIVSTIDLEGPFLDNISKADYERLQGFLPTLNNRRLVWLTRSSQVCCTDPRYGLLTGWARCLRQELSLHVWTIELSSEDPPALAAVDAIWRRVQAQPLTAEGIEHEYAVHDGTVYTGRYHWTPMTEELSVKPQGDNRHATQMVLEKYADVGSLSWAQVRTPELRDDEVEVEVRCTALNFRDIMIAMGFMYGPKDGFGFEASGVVTRMGAAVTHVGVGDAVMMIGSGLFATKKIVSGGAVVGIPGGLSFEDAATMPIAYATAIHAMMNVGQLAKGQSLLIHSACGGVGLAAIHIGEMLGAEIYATVGTEDKVKYLMEHGIPRERIFSSRDASFRDGVMRETGGRGVDMVLNSLSGDLLHASWECVARRGKMMEIGKRDMLEGGHVAMHGFQGNRALYGIDLDALFREAPDEGVELLQQVVTLHLQGWAKPIRPVRVFGPQQVSEAFRHMQTGKHMGKIVVSMPADAVTPGGLSELELSAQGTYLLVGGLGGLGKALASFMVEGGARQLLFFSRTAGQSDEDQAFLRELRAQGCEAIAVAGSVTKMADVQAAIDAAPTAIAGVIQMVMVLENKPVMEMRHDEWTAVTEPKVRGTWNLHEALGANLDFFVLLSSLSGVLGAPHQANYDAANTFLDSFMQYRHSLGLPCSVMDLGAVEDVGFMSHREESLSQFRRIGLHMTGEREFLDAAQVCIQQSQTNFQDVPADTRGYVNAGQIAVGLASKSLAEVPPGTPFRTDIRLSMHRAGKQEEAVGSRDQGGESVGGIVRAVAAQPGLLREAATQERLEKELVRTLCALMHLREGVQADTSLASIGVDSLASIEVRNWWRRVLGVDVSVLDVVGAGTVGGLGRLAVASLRRKHGVEME